MSLMLPLYWALCFKFCNDKRGFLWSNSLSFLSCLAFRRVAKLGKWLGSGSPKSISSDACRVLHTWGSDFPSQSSFAISSRTCPERGRLEQPVCNVTFWFLRTQWNSIGVWTGGSSRHRACSWPPQSLQWPLMSIYLLLYLAYGQVS